MVVAVGDGVADTMSLMTAEVSAVAVSTAWRATTLIPSATAGCRRAMVMKSSKLFQETRRRSIDQGRRLSISGRVSLESARICYISLRVDRGLLSALGRYCSMGGSRRSDRAEQVSAASWGIGTRRNRVNPVRCRETRHVDGRPGAEVDEVKSVEVEMDGDTEVWYGYCAVAERGSGRGRALAGKLLRHGPSRGAGAEAGPKAGGGLSWPGKRAVWSVLVALPGSRFSPSKQNRGPSLEQPVASPGHFAGGRFLGEQQGV